MTNGRTTLWAVIAIVIAILAIVLIAAAFFAPTADFQFDGQHMTMGSGWVWWMALMMIGAVVIIALIVVVILYVLRPSTPSGPYYPPQPPIGPYYPPQPPIGYDQTAEGKREALEVLGQRYARGEVTREEYLRMKDDLK